MKLFIDENLSPTLVGACHQAGYDATCTRDRKKLGKGDPPLARLCFQEERICVTVNDSDFRELAERDGLHAGLITMPSVSGARQRELMELAIAVIERLAEEAGEQPASYMINHVLELENDGSWMVSLLPEDSQ